MSGTFLRPYAFHPRRTVGFSPGLWSFLSRSVHRDYQRKILTLRPEKLAEVQQQVIDISHRMKPNCWTKDSAGRDFIARLEYTRPNIPFPEKTKGVLYHYQPPNEPESYGELRFRLCDTIDAFHSGRDLQCPDGSAWRIGLFLQAHKRHHYTQGWHHLVIKENFPRREELFVPSKIRTFHPERMAEVGQEIFDLSGSRAATLHFLHPTSMRPRVTYVHFTSRDHSLQQFPPDAQGVFYFYRDPNLPLIAGQVRFRICVSPAQFHEGRDLLTPSGEYWHIPLYRLASKNDSFEAYRSFRNQLVRDGLVDVELLNDIGRLPVAGSTFSNCHLFTLGQPMTFDLSQASRQMYVLTRYMREKVCLPRFFVDGRRKEQATSPYTGKILARLEILPESEENGDPKIVLRVLEILEPIKCVIPKYDDHMPPPVVGDLVRQSRFLNYPPFLVRSPALQKLVLYEASGR